MRLDKYLADEKIGTRSEVKKMIRKGMVAVNGAVITSPELQIKEGNDSISYQGKIISYIPFVYYMMNKPAGIITATKDKKERTVLDLILEEKKESLIPVGRLDKDTEGLLLFTNDGKLCHDLLSPKKHVNKTYLVKLQNEITNEDVDAFKTGVDIKEEKLTLPAECTLLDNFSCYLTIREGKFHQVKRMFEARNNCVLYLKRIQMGSLKLDDTLEPGDYRELTSLEVSSLYQL